VNNRAPTKYRHVKRETGPVQGKARGGACLSFFRTALPPKADNQLRRNIGRFGPGATFSHRGKSADFFAVGPQDLEFDAAEAPISLGLRKAAKMAAFCAANADARYSPA
jgi:hypothetical protein